MENKIRIIDLPEFQKTKVLSKKQNSGPISCSYRRKLRNYIKECKKKCSRIVHAWKITHLTY